MSFPNYDDETRLIIKKLVRRLHRSQVLPSTYFGFWSWCCANLSGKEVIHISTYIVNKEVFATKAFLGMIMASTSYYHYDEDGDLMANASTPFWVL